MALIATIAKLSINALIGYIVSWLVFLLTLPIFIRIFGRVKGATIDYIVSWGVLLGIMYILTVIYPDGDEVT